jgi:DNA polymerase III epsilon subunit-like protein
MPIDFASILFGRGYDPSEYYDKQKEFVKQFGIDAIEYKQHNALDDARLLRETYLALAKKRKVKK